MGVGSDIALGLNPVTAFAQCLFEAGFGKTIGGEPLPDWGRALAVAGVLSLGSSKQMQTISRVLGRFKIPRIVGSAEGILGSAQRIGIRTKEGLGRVAKAIKYKNLPNPKAVPADLQLLGVGDPLKKAAGWIKSEPGKFDVIIHGSDEAFHVLHNGKYVELSHRDLTRYIKLNGWDGKTPIRLISCSTGACDIGAAKNLANKLGVKVQAPSDTVWLHSNGNLTIGPDEFRNSGVWQTFEPSL